MLSVTTNNLHIRLLRESALCEHLWGHPPDWQVIGALYHIDTLHLQGCTKVSYLQHLVNSNQDVSASHVSVDNVEASQELLKWRH